jgi:hypothetical protein
LLAQLLQHRLGDEAFVKVEDRQIPSNSQGDADVATSSNRAVPPTGFISSPSGNADLAKPTAGGAAQDVAALGSSASRLASSRSGGRARTGGRR